MVYDHFTILSLLYFIKINNSTKKVEKVMFKSEKNMTAPPKKKHHKAHLVYIVKYKRIYIRKEGKSQNTYPQTPGSKKIFLKTIVF